MAAMEGQLPLDNRRERDREGEKNEGRERPGGGDLTEVERRTWTAAGTRARPGGAGLRPARSDGGDEGGEG